MEEVFVPGFNFGEDGVEFVSDLRFCKQAYEVVRLPQGISSKTSLILLHV